MFEWLASYLWQPEEFYDPDHCYCCMKVIPHTKKEHIKIVASGWLAPHLRVGKSKKRVQQLELRA